MPGPAKRLSQGFQYPPILGDFGLLALVLGSGLID